MLRCCARLLLSACAFPSPWVFRGQSGALPPVLDRRSDAWTSSSRSDGQHRSPASASRGEARSETPPPRRPEVWVVAAPDGEEQRRRRQTHHSSALPAEISPHLSCGPIGTAAPPCHAAPRHWHAAAVAPVAMPSASTIAIRGLRSRPRRKPARRCSIGCCVRPASMAIGVACPRTTSSLRAPSTWHSNSV